MRPDRARSHCQRRCDLERSQALFWAAAVLLALLAAAPLWGPGIVNTRGGGDSPFLLQRTMEMAETLRHGVLPPRWMSHAAYGLGYPFFNHYAALPYYVSGALTVLGVNILSAIQTTQTLGFLFAAVTMGLWSRRIFRSRAAQLLAVAAYTFAPFHLVNVYVRGDSLSEFYAFVWYPLILWSLDRVAERPNPPAVLGGGLSYGALILTHNVSALIFSPFALLYGLIIIAPPLRQHYRDSLNVLRKRGFLAVIGVFAVGILLSAWFWIPAVMETDYVQLGPAFTEDYFHYTSHFRGLDLIQPSLFFDYSVAVTVHEAGPFAAGLAQVTVALAGATVLVSHLLKRAQVPRDIAQYDRRRQWFLLAGAALASVMITSLSRPFWDTLPLLEITQFPWRFLSVQALFTAALSGAVAELAWWPTKIPLSIRRALNHVLGSIGAVLVIGAALMTLRPDRLRINSHAVTWENLLFYEAFTGNIGTTIRHEWLPRDVVPRPYISDAVIDGEGQPIADGDAELIAQLAARSPHHQIWHVDLRYHAASVAFPVHWWPGWQAVVKGIPVDSYPLPGSGWLGIKLEPGIWTVDLRLRATPLQQLAIGVSTTVGLLALGVTIGSEAYRRTMARGMVRIAGAALSCLLLALVGPILLQKTPDSPAVFFDFQQMPYPHQGPIEFGEALLVSAVSADVTQTATGPGQKLETVLGFEMRTAEPLTATLRLVSPAEPRHGIKQGIAEISAPVSSQTRLLLSLPDDLSRGLYLLQLRLHSPDGELRAHTEAGSAMGPLYVGSLRISQAFAKPPSSPPLAVLKDMTLHSVETRQTEPDTLPLRMIWSTPGTPRNWRLSLRLLDLDGNLRVQQDAQPGYGYLPTTLWHPEERIVDNPHLALPNGLAPGAYTLRVVAYLQNSMEGGGEVDIPIQVTLPTLYDLRKACCELNRKGATILCQAEGVVLLGLEAPSVVQEVDTLYLQAEWSAQLVPADDLRATWSLIDPYGAAVVSTTSPLAPGSPTSLWPRHTWVLSPVRLALPPRVPEGDYELTLSMAGAEGKLTDCGVLTTVTVQSSPRSFDIPSVPHPQTAVFGNSVKLLGYALSEDQKAQEVRLTVWWQALQTPELDYTRFVHLYDPETEEIVAQEDGAPRGWTYPTTWWLKGEVVSETVKLSMSGAPQGTYHLAVGWYIPETMNRLTVTGADDALVSDNRVTLTLPVTHP